MTHAPAVWTALGLCAALLAGCGSSAPTREHVLSAPPQTSAAARFPSSVGVGPVSVAEYLDRLQLVSRDAEGAVVVSDTRRWAEPLRDGLARVLSEALASLLGAGRIAVHPWPPASAPELHVPVEVLRFDSRPDGQVRLEARWAVRRADGAVLLAQRTSVVEVEAGGGVDARVGAHGQAAARLAREIAAGLREVGPR